MARAAQGEGGSERVLEGGQVFEGNGRAVSEGDGAGDGYGGAPYLPRVYIRILDPKMSG